MTCSCSAVEEAESVWIARVPTRAAVGKRGAMRAISAQLFAVAALLQCAAAVNLIIEGTRDKAFLQQLIKLCPFLLASPS